VSGNGPEGGLPVPPEPGSAAVPQGLVSAIVNLVGTGPVELGA
jgi:hypothetical protein